MSESAHVKTVRLQNFKNFRDATLHLGPLTVIVGTNASGKSNLRDAFRFLHGIGRGYSLADIVGERYGRGGELVWSGIRGGTQELAFNGETELTISSEWNSAANEGLSLASFVHSLEMTLLEPVLKVEKESFGWGHVCSNNESVDPVLFGATPLMERSAQDYSTEQLYDTEFPLITQSKTANSSVENFLTYLDSMRFLDLVPQAMKIPSLPGQTVLGDRGENLSSVLHAICEDPSSKMALAEWVSELTPLDVVDFDFVADQTGKILVTLIESNGQRTSAYSASDGTLRFLAILAALLGPKSSKFYFLEELDTGIHPTRFHLLLQLIEQQTKAGNVQVVITTHSPQLLGMLSEESREHASLVYRLPGSSEGHIKRIMDIPAAQEVLETQNLGRLHESGWLENAVAFSDEEAQA